MAGPTVYLAEFPSVASSFNIDAVHDDPSPFKNELGQTRYVNGKLYQYWKCIVEGAVALAANHLMFLGADPAKGVYTATTDSATKSLNNFVGVTSADGVPTDGNATWLQLSGVGKVFVANGGANVVIGDAIIPTATNKGEVNQVTMGTAPTYRPVGWGHVAITKNNAGLVMLSICPLP